MKTKVENQATLSSRELADRWKMNPGTLRAWRASDRGPSFSRIGRKIIYLLREIEKYEMKHSVKIKER